MIWTKKKRYAEVKIGNVLSCILGLIAGALFSVVMIYFMTFITTEKNKIVTVEYNCGIAEISPDIPVSVKEECRKRMEK